MKIYLETERLILREFTETDLRPLIDLNADPEVMRHLEGSPICPERIRQEVLPTFLRFHVESPQFGYWAVIEKRTGEFIGWFQFRPKDIPEKGVELGYRLKRSAWNKGYATEGCRALIEKGFTELGVRRVFAKAMASHLASIRVMQKIGLKFLRSYAEPEFPTDQQSAVVYGTMNPLHSLPRDATSDTVQLRNMTDDDLPILFEYQFDPVANHMAAFTVKNPADRQAFMAKWSKILGDDTVTKMTILFAGRVAGSVVSFVAPWSGEREVSYWIAREFWGKGIATKALSELLGHLKTRPLYARAAKDNIASLRVLEKCGFTISGYERGFANARGEEIEEVVFELKHEIQCVVALDPVADLSNADHEEVRLLSLAVYPPEQFADWPGRQVEWSTPEWCVRIRNEGNVLVSYVGVYLRTAGLDGRPARIGGVGNVKTHPGARRRGLAGLGIRRALQFFREQHGVNFALLVCEPSLLPYYAHLGWREFRGRLLVRQHGTACEFTLNRVMTHGVQAQGPEGGAIDLLGPPW